MGKFNRFVESEVVKSSNRPDQESYVYPVIHTYVNLIEGDF